MNQEEALGKAIAAAHEASEAARAASQAACEATTAVREQTAVVREQSRVVAKLVWSLEHLWRLVDRDGPPPPPDGWTPPSPDEPIPKLPPTAEPPLADKVQQLIVGHEEIQKELKKQSLSMGIDKSGWGYFTSPEGQKQLYLTLGLVAAIIGAVAGIVNAWRAPQPAPPPPPPAYYAPPSPAVVYPAPPPTYYVPAAPPASFALPAPPSTYQLPPATSARPGTP